MTDKTSINGEPDTLRGVSPVRRGACTINCVRDKNTGG